MIMDEKLKARLEKIGIYAGEGARWDNILEAVCADLMDRIEELEKKVVEQQLHEDVDA